VGIMLSIFWVNVIDHGCLHSCFTGPRFVSELNRVGNDEDPFSFVIRANGASRYSFPATIIPCRMDFTEDSLEGISAVKRKNSWRVLKHRPTGSKLA
jgi:hypothetical protein